MDGVSFAWATAIAVAVPCRKKACEHTVFGVKDGQMMVSNNLDALPLGRGQGTRKCTDLRCIEIVSKREALQAVAEQVSGADQVGCVQRKITMQHRYAGFTVIQQGPAATVLLKLMEESR